MRLGTRLRRNLAANFVAQVWAVALGLAFVPVFLRLLGVEGYGLVGFAASLQAVLVVLDLGLGTAANREFSRATARASSPAENRILLRTLEVPYFIIGGFIALILVLASSWIAKHWVHSEAIAPETIQTTLVLLGLTVGLRWPVGLYSGVLRGLEHQVALNLVVLAGSTLRTVGAAAVLVLGGGGVVTYFACLLAVGALEVAVMAALAWRYQPPSDDEPARFDRAVFGSVWAFSGQLTLISLFAGMLKQMDKVVIARYEPLAALGSYTVAVTLAGGLLLFAAPVFGAVFPRFSSLVLQGDEAGVSRLYHRSSRLVAMLSSPAAAVLIFFPGSILTLWTGSPIVSGQAAGALSVLAFAMLLNSCMQIPYGLQLAAGLTRISLWTNGVAVVVLLPVLVMLVQAYGILGGGIAWAVFNVAYVAVVPVVMHRRVLRGELGGWWTKDILPFLAVAGLCFGGAAWLARARSDILGVLVLIAAATVAYAAIVAVTWGRGAVRFGTSADQPEPGKAW